MAGIIHRVENPGLSETEFEHFCELYLELLIELTPVDTGFCQSQWSYQIDPDYGGATFINDADYSEYLDRGHSKQAPNGMTGPADLLIYSLAARSRGY